MGWVFIVPKPSLKHVNNPHFPQKKCVFYRNLLARGPKKKGSGRAENDPSPRAHGPAGWPENRGFSGFSGFGLSPTQP